MDLKKEGKVVTEDESENCLLGRSLGNGQAKVIPGERILIREDTVVGCTECSGNKLIGYSKVKFGPSLCWNKNIESRYSICIIVTSAIIFILCLTGTILLFFTNAFQSTIISKMALKNNTQAYELWANPPVRPYMKVHIFNYTNAYEFLEGKEPKLRVKDVGPYVYEQTVQKVNVKFHPNGTLTYQTKKSFEFIPEKTVGTQYDKLLVPNLPMVSAVSMVKESYYVTRVGLSTLFSTLKVKPFLELPAHRYMWGYDDELISLAKGFIKLAPDIPSVDTVGILASLNGTNRDVITINTGEKDMTKFAIIDRYNGYTKMNHWGTDECNSIDATDGSMFPPWMLDGKQRLHIYSEQACRRLPLEYVKDVEVMHGIKAKRYSLPENVFASPDVNPENQCYCHMDSATCPPNGLFNTTPCNWGAPAFASFPHFYLGDPEIINAIDGLEPGPDKFAMYMDIHPTLGFPVAAVSRLQFNLQLRKAPGITGSGLDALPNDLVLPVAWIEFSLDELPPFIKSIIYHGTYSANAVRLILSWGCVIGVFVSGLVLALATRNKLIHRKNSKRVPLPVITTKT